MTPPPPTISTEEGGSTPAAASASSPSPSTPSSSNKGDNTANSKGDNNSSTPRNNRGKFQKKNRGNKGGGNSNNNNKDSENEINYSSSSTMRFKQFCKLLEFDNMTVTIYIPTVCVGALIGRKGSTIGMIQKQAQQLAGAHSDQVRISIVHHHSQAAQGAGSGGGGEHYPQQFSPGMSPSTPPTGTTENSASTTPTTPNNATVVLPSMTYTELDFSDKDWTPVVIHAHSIACLYISAQILDICIEWVTDRTQIQYIFDLPIKSGSNSNNSGGNSGTPSSTNSSSAIHNAHATIIGKRGQTLMALSATTGCRIMVPPKHLGHDIVQLEGPLQECTACLEAIANLLATGSGGGSGAGNVDSILSNISPTSPKQQSSNAANNTKSIAKNAQIRSNDNKFQVSFIVMPLPSQTKLRNIARRTETVIRKKRLSKSALEGIQNTTSAVAARKTKAAKAAAAGGDDDEEDTTSASDTNNAKSPSTANAKNNTAVPWQLYVLGSSKQQVVAARKKLKPFLIKNIDGETNIELRDAMSVASRKTGSGKKIVADDASVDDADIGSDDEDSTEEDLAVATSPKGTRAARADSTVSSSTHDTETAGKDDSESGPSPGAALTPSKGGGRGRRNRSNSHGKK